MLWAPPVRCFSILPAVPCRISLTLSCAAVFHVLWWCRYSVCGIWGVLRNPLRPIKVTIKDTNQVYEDDMATVFVNQTQHFGKEMRAAPAAVLDDGFFDLNIMFKQTRGMLLRVFALLPTGAHTHAIPGTVERQARHVVMEPRSPGVINVDGENFKYVPHHACVWLFCVAVAVLCGCVVYAHIYSCSR